MRNVVYVSGTRADFGLMRGTLLRAARDARLRVAVCVTGMHLLPRYGSTVDEIVDAGLPIAARIPVALGGADGLDMARALGIALAAMAESFAASRPDGVVVLGDRGEMLAAALAALHLNISVFHIHGGERSGTVDEPVRHAISKLAHYHFAATPGARDRLVRMGEREDRVFVTGAPGLDDLVATAPAARDDVFRAHGLAPSAPLCLLVFHPVVQQAAHAGEQMNRVLDAALATGMQVLCLRPNSDAGAAQIDAAIDARAASAPLHVATHLRRDEYVALLAAAEVMIGNSSSGIIEAATFGTPVVNIGDRQRERERSGNVIDCAPDTAAIAGAIAAARALRGRSFANVYGDGRAGERIVELLATLPIDAHVLEKTNAY